MRNKGKSWRRYPKVRWRYLLRAHYYGAIRRAALAATNAHEYDNVTARKLALAKYTSDSCMVSPYSRLHAKSILREVGLVPRARKGVSLLRESRYRIPRALTRIRARIALASRLPATRVAFARQGEDKARQGKARRLSDDKYGFTERLPVVGRYWILLVATYVRGFAAASIHTRGSKFDRANDELLE